MPEQFNDITSFRAYQKQIYEYLNNRMVQIPLFFENQNAVNNTIIPSNTSNIGGNFQQTIRDGKVVKGKRVDEVFTAFDNVYANNQDDLNIIEYIAYKLNGLSPHEAIIDVDAFIYTGDNTAELVGPISTIPDFYNENIALSAYVYIPYVDLKNINEKVLLNYNSGLETLQGYFDTINIPGANFEDFKTQLLAKNINLSVKNYNLSDNTSNFLPVGVQKRRVSKKVLKDSSETTITELLPETDSYLISEFFKSWEKIKQKLPSGQEYIQGSTFLNAGNFAGGVGPGNYRFWLNENTDGEPINNIVPIPTDYDFFANINPTSLWNTGNVNDAIASQRVVQEENPGLSSFCFATQRNAPAWYTINVEDVENNFIPGVSYTLSGWQTQDANFGENNYEELKPGRFFFFKLDAVMTDGSFLPVIGFPDSTLTQAEFLPLISGEAVEVWQGSEKIWTRYKKTFTIPVSANNTPVDIDGNEITDGWTGNYKLTWFLGYQNSVELVEEGLYDGALEGGGIEGETTPSNIWDGPTIRSNTNYASQYYTGLRLNVGEQITGITKLPLQNIQPLTTARILHDCIKLLEPDFPQRNIPIYSDAKLQELILSQQNTALITSTLNEIKQGLINALKSFIDGASETYAGIGASLQANTDDSGNIDIDAITNQLKLNFEIMIAESGIKNQLVQLENAIIATFSAVTTNLTGLVEDAELNGYYQLLPGISEYGAPGFKQLDSDGLIFGAHLGISYPQSFNQANDPGLQRLVNNRYNSQLDNSGAAIPFLPPNPQAAEESVIPFMLNHSQPGSNYNSDVLKSYNDWYYADNGTYIRNFFEQYKEPFIQIHKTRYKLPNSNFNGGAAILNSSQYALPPGNNYSYSDVFGTPTPGDTDWYALAGDKYDEPYFHETLKKYLFNNTTTPIGAFYASEMLEDGIDSNAAKGYTNQYAFRPNNYPGTGYGPYSAPNLTFDNPSDFNTDFGYTNGIERMKVVYDIFLEQYSINDEDYVQPNVTKQFLNLNNLFSDVESLEDAVSSNEGFAELETYTLDFHSGLELVAFCYPELLTADPEVGFGWRNIDINPSGTQPSLSAGVENVTYWGSLPMYAREDFYHAMTPLTLGAPTFLQLGGKVTMRFYEPHWEWNPLRGEWVFRLAQPIIGSEWGVNSYDGGKNNPILNADIIQGFTTNKFEKKYKFTKMAYIKKG